MTEREMFEKSFQRPSNYFKLSEERQWEIDKDLGILDWMGFDLTEEDKQRFRRHYDRDLIVEILKSDPKLGIKKGQRYIAETYSIDPSKITLKNIVTHEGRVMKREANCNQYRSEVKIVD